MTKPARIETNRLLLREQLETDAAVWGPLAVDPEFRRYVPWRRGDETPEERAARSIGNLMRRWESDPLSSMGWVIERRSDGQFLGTGGVDQTEDADAGELDYFFGKPFWGQGYGREAAHAMARFALDHTAWRRLVAYIVPGNVGSIRIVEGLGMRFVEEVDYMQFFPDPSVIELSSSLTWMYAADRKDLTLRNDGYRVLPG